MKSVMIIGRSTINSLDIFYFPANGSKNPDVL